jgi:hypothetical protein
MMRSNYLKMRVSDRINCNTSQRATKMGDPELQAWLVVECAALIGS